MKYLTLISLSLLLSVGVAMGQSKTRYFEYTAYFTLTNGCESSARATYSTTNNYAITYREAKSAIAKWLKPNKLKVFRLSGVKEIKKSEQQKPNKFHCPEPLNFSFISDTTKLISSLSGSAQGLSSFTYQPQYYVFNGGLNGRAVLKIDMPKLPIDSLTLHLNKSQLRWINDSTAVITPHQITLIR